ncbi:hypothetical protein ACVCII_04195 [Burkholderia glumae]|uniref:hypothetical protein n=1 Tax=Burkholderia glumae TaxID=337 RepID=UPI002036831A|nr:hypothetical protein [Burkholderia glumae]MCM2546163.1 hypothetical protein [Burkholderia glumae]
MATNSARKEFFVAGLNGRTIMAFQLATFAHYIENIRFRFVVTQIPGAAEVVLTHRNSGRGVCVVPHISIQAAAGDYVVAARSELKKVIERNGVARVRSVLAGAE